MTPERWARIAELFAGAADRPSGERAAWLAEQTRDDPTLVPDVTRLLASDERDGGILDRPVEVPPDLADDSDSSTLQPGESLGRYEIVELLGTGGMGHVYRATDSLLHRTVAIKLLHSALPGTSQELLREARAVSVLNHPNICTLHALEESDGRAFLVMEYVSGTSLQALAREGLTRDQVIRYGREIADALRHAHEHGVVHRDLKTTNILIAEDGHVKVLDFGIASRVAVGANSLASVSPGHADGWAGTLPYVAPERLQGAAGNEASDIWALGVVLHEMATGRLPFAGGSGAAVAEAILTGERSALPAQWPRAFSDIVGRCLSLSPEKRYSSAGEISTALAALERRHGFMTPMSAALAAAATLAVVWGLATWSGAFKAPAVPRTFTTVAVLPFKPLDASVSDPALELGLADGLITALSGLPGITMRPIGAVSRYANQPTEAAAAGRDLKVEAVIEGTVQRIGDELRVSVRLYNVADGASLWGEAFDATGLRVLELQDSVARRVASQLSPKLDQEAWKALAARGTRDLDAYREYLDGRYAWNQRTETAFRSALIHFQRAAALDPDYAPAYAGIADCQTLLGIWGAGPIAETVAPARDAVQRALRNDALPEAHGSAALVRWVYDWNWEKADREFTRALELNPNYATARQWYAYFLASRQRFDEAVTQIERAREQDPLSLSIRTDLGELHAWARQYDDAVATLRGVLDVDPNFPMAHNILGLAYLLQGRAADGVRELERARQIDDGPRMMSTLAYGYGVSGDRTRAMAVIAELEQLSRRRHVSPFAFALAYTGLGDRDRALSWLERAFEERSDTMAILAVYPWLDPLRGDPRFRALLARTDAAKLP